MECYSQKLDKLYDFIAEFGHLSEYFAINHLTTEDYYRLFADFRQLEELDLLQLTKLISGESSIDLNDKVKRFFKGCHQLQLPRDCIIESTKLSKDIKLGMNAKKVVEVENLATKIDEICKRDGISHILDLGCGQGYLSSALAYHYNYNVVGYDQDICQTTGAAQRSKRIYNLLGHRKIKVTGSLEFITEKMTIKDNYETVFNVIFNSYPHLENKRWLICGLHCCGDLSSTMIRSFQNHLSCKYQKASVAALVSLGCCYQMLTEKCVENRNPQTKNGFPLSTAASSLYLGLNTRMVACQATKRWSVDFEDFAESIRRLYYRACLEKLLKDQGIKTPTMDIANALLPNASGERGIKKLSVTEYSDPILYTTAALKRLGSTKSIPDGTILATFDWHQSSIKEIQAIWTCRTLLGDVVESLILIDRYLFLKENGMHAEICSIVDPSISPRNMAIICLNPFKDVLEYNHE